MARWRGHRGFEPLPADLHNLARMLAGREAEPTAVLRTRAWGSACLKAAQSRLPPPLRLARDYERLARTRPPLLFLAFGTLRRANGVFLANWPTGAKTARQSVPG